MDDEMVPCEFCGEERISNSRIIAQRTVDYLDGPNPARIPETVLCQDCAAEVTDYFNERIQESDNSPEVRSAFTEEDVDVILERLKENSRLVLGPTSGYGLRYKDGEWKFARHALPDPPAVITFNREQAEELILESPKISLSRLDKAAWNRFKVDQLGR